MAPENPVVSEDLAGTEIEVRANPSGLGAEIACIDLSKLKRNPQMDRIKDAFLRHHVIFFRRQTVSDDEFLSLAKEFGEVQNHLNYRVGGSPIPAIHEVTNLDASGKPSEDPLNNENYYWHSDKAYLPRTASATMLYAVEIPPRGGDTEFADMTRAYETLSIEEKQTIKDLNVVHSWRHMRATLSNRSLTEEEGREFPDVIHPLVRVHPDTGAKSLFLGMYAAKIIGMSEEDGRRLLTTLLEHSSQRRFVYRHQWQPHDLVLWDNRCLMHRAVPNYEQGSYRRILRRVVVQGT
jgi:alpha-ketoglutarate-dependent taurine dioxygenase